MYVLQPARFEDVTDALISIEGGVQKSEDLVVSITEKPIKDPKSTPISSALQQVSRFMVASGDIASLRKSAVVWWSVTWRVGNLGHRYLCTQ